MTILDHNMQLTALISIIGPDRVGLVSAICARLFDLGANLGDTTFSTLGDDADFTAICEFSTEMTIETLQNELETLPETAAAKVKVTQFDLSMTQVSSETITHTISISGGDSPGLMARLCEVFEQFGANIVRLNSERVPGASQAQYVISAAVCIPQENANSCLATITNTAGELGLHCNYVEIT